MGDNFLKTTKFDNMIQAFECDFDLARQGENNIKDLDDKIKSQDKRLMKDIDLLCELSYLIRGGYAEIRIKQN